MQPTRPDLPRAMLQVLALGVLIFSTLWIVDKGGSIGMLLINFLVTVVVCAILYSNGETAALEVRRFARRLAGAQGEGGLFIGPVVLAVAYTLLTDWVSDGQDPRTPELP